MQETQFHPLADGRQIAFRQLTGTGPTLVFLPGYMSDMAGSKAAAVFDFAARSGRACLLLDYSGCGESSGDFADGTLSRWRDEVLALIEARLEADSPVLLIGSSMGGWLMLLVGQALGPRLEGMIGIAAAPDFTQWGYDTDEQAVLASGEVLRRHNPYGPEPTPTHPGFWQDGQALRQLDGEIAITAPVRLLHGQDDAEVPPAISARLTAALRSDDVQLTLVKRGDHRLSREGDIALLLQTITTLG